MFIERKLKKQPKDGENVLSCLIHMWDILKVSNYSRKYLK